MNVFIQGMRRSGTTILYDLFCQDPQWDCYYEPLAAGRVALGGGSGVQDQDLLGRVRELREQFSARSGGVADEEFNYGAPAKPALELERHVPDAIRDYLAMMLSQAPDTVVKFTRMYRKTGLLHELDDSASFIHIVRHPMAVVASYIFGRDRADFDRFGKPDRFFAKRSGTWLRRRRLPWSASEFSDLILAGDAFSHIDSPTDVVRVLAIWKYVFRETHADAEQHFGPRYRLVRHEELASDPHNGIEDLYHWLGRQMPHGLGSWVEEHIVPPRPLYREDDGRWREAISLVGLEEELEAAGYGF